MAGDLLAGAPFYGAAPSADDVAKISAPLMIHSAEDDKRINAMWPDFESALQANDKEFQRFVYEGTRHGFHNNSTPRYNEAAANSGIGKGRLSCLSQLWCNAIAVPTIQRLFLLGIASIVFVGAVNAQSSIEKQRFNTWLADLNDRDLTRHYDLGSKQSAIHKALVASAC